MSKQQGKVTRRRVTKPRFPQFSRGYDGPPEETQRFEERLRFDQSGFWDFDASPRSDCGVSTAAWLGNEIDDFFRPGKVRCGGGWHTIPKQAV